MSNSHIAVFSHPDCLNHDTGSTHPECAGRLQAIFDVLKASDISAQLDFVIAPLALITDLLLAHDRNYVNVIYDAELFTGYAHLDADTVISAGSFCAALRAVGAGIAAADALITGQYKHAFCAVRPPGHHAMRNRAMGFCLFNNIAITAFYILKRSQLARIAIIDFDVHHGNGTQDIIEFESRILYISLHQSPCYPGTGTYTENRINHILNVPLLPGTDGMTYRQIFIETVMPVLESFKPNLLLVSAGFDAHSDDPLANLNLVEEDYYWIGQQLSTIANKYCDGQLISFLEGGYNLNVLGASIAAYLQGCR